MKIKYDMVPSKPESGEEITAQLRKYGYGTVRREYGDVFEVE